MEVAEGCKKRKKSRKSGYNSHRALSLLKHANKVCQVKNYSKIFKSIALRALIGEKVSGEWEECKKDQNLALTVDALYEEMI